MTEPKFTIALAQLNPTVGDVAGNADKARARARQGRGRGRRSRGAARTVHLRLSAGGPGAQAGVPGRLPRRGRGAGARDRDGGPAHADRHALGRGRQALQCLSRCSMAARIAAVRFKVESAELRRVRRKARVRAAARCRGRSTVRGVRLGVPICEDIWPSRDEDVVECLAETGAEILIVPNGSPYCARQGRRAAQRSRWPASPRAACRWSIVNQVGGQDELVFDGASFALNADRSLAVAAAGVRGEHRQRCTGRKRADGWRCSTGRSCRWSRATRAITRPACWACATTSTRTASPAWCSACPAASIPRSCAAMAVDALGAERVRCVMLPYRFTAQESLDDAAKRRQGARRALRDAADRGRRCKGFEASAGAALRRPAARRHRGEPAGARARHAS